MNMTASRQRASARACPAPAIRRALPMALALALAAPACHAADAAQDITPVVVTAPMPSSPLTVVTDPKAPRQPVPASDGADLLKSIPGFSMIRKGGSNGDPVFRGMVGSRLNIVVDGGQIAGGCPARMDPPTAYIAPELFDKVVLIKGPETVIHGPGNSAGTVLFEREFKRYTENSWSLDGSLLGGSWGRNDQTLDLRAGTPTFYMDVRANHTHSQDYEDGDGHRVHSSWDRWNADVALGWTPDDDTRVELSAGKGNGRAAYAFSLMDGVQFLRHSVGLTFDRKHLSPTLTRLQASAYYNDADHVMDNYTLREPDPSSMMPMPMASNPARITVGGRVAATFEWDGAFKLVTGMDGSSNTHTTRMGGPPGSMIGYFRDMPRVRDARIGTVGAFGELTWNLAPRQRLISGARVDRAHARGYQLTASAPMTSMVSMPGMSTTVVTAAASRSETLPSGFIRYERDLPHAPATFYAGIGHVERFPDYWEMFGRHVDASVAAFLGLKPEKTTQLDIGVQYRNARLRAWVSGYAGVVSDYILLHYAQGMGGLSQASNVQARIGGGEAGVRYAFTPRWKGDATLSYAWGQNRTEHRPLPQMPPLEVRLGLTYARQDWSLGALWRGVTAQHRIAVGEGNIVGQDLGPSAGFAVFSLNGSLRLSTRWLLTAGVDNVFDRTYAEHVDAVNAGLLGYVNTVRVNEPGRTAWVKLNLSM